MAVQPLEAFNQEEWWKNPGLQVNADGSAASYDVRDYFQPMGSAWRLPNERTIDTPMPQFGLDMGLTNPGTAYDFYQRNAGTDVWADAMVDAEATRARRDASMDVITGTKSQVEGDLQRFEDDPDRALVREQLRNRADPGFTLLSDVEKTQIDLQLAQAVALSRNEGAANAAGRGTASSGLAAQRDTAIETIGRVGGVQLDAMQALQDRAAQEKALTDLGSLSFKESGVRELYGRTLAQIDQNMLALESGQLIDPMSAVDIGAAEQAVTQYEDAMAQMQIENARLDKELEPNLFDWANIFFQFLGAGGAEMIEGIFEMFAPKDN